MRPTSPVQAQILKIASALVLGVFTLIPNKSMATETPKYAVIKEDGNFEIRRYAPRIVAEVSVSGELDNASSQGFRLLAGYIFGDNRISTPQAMTVSPDQSTKIAMTAPVTLEPLDQTPAMTASRQWRVEFTMPSEYTLATLPKPTNSAVQIREVPARTYAAIRYSGLNTESRINEETSRLQVWTQQQGLESTGVAELARYNPPWTLPMFRRNEILIPIKDPS
jgi:hypothetical protein